MARIEIPSLNPLPVREPETVSPAVAEETKFAPVLLTQLRDDLSRSRLREAFWISAVTHLVVVILLMLSPKWIGWHPVKLRTAEQMIQDKNLTYMELPPDRQRPLAKAPNTKILSDKNRIASSRMPTPDQKTLESLRKGLPSPSGPPIPESSPPGAQSAPATQAAQQQANNNAAAARAPQPQQQQPQKSLSAMAGGLSAGSAIEQAARNSARGGFSGGGSGNYGTPSGGGGGKVGSGIDVLSDTMGVDFGPYLSRVLQAVRMNWYNLIPEEARAPLMKRGTVGIEFVILPDGKVAGMRLSGQSGDIALDRAAWGGITASNPFPPLPGEFHGPYLALRFRFLYNPDPRELQ